MATSDDIAQLQALAATLAADAGVDSARYADVLAQLQVAVSRYTTDEATLSANQATIAGLQGQIAQLQAQLAATKQPPAPLAAFPRLLWHDEFDGAAVDTTKWNVRNGWVGGNESSICWARNVSVANSCLVIQPKREQSQGYTNGQLVTRQYTSGYVDTIGKLDIPKGSYVEFLGSLPVKPNVSAGMWPAYWFRLDAGSLEIDLMEAWGTPSLKADTGGKFWFSVWPNTMTPTVASGGIHGPLDAPALDLTQWHTYGLRVDTDGTVSPYFDGKASSFVTWVNGVKTLVPKVTPAMVPGLGWDPAKDKLRIRLNLQVGQPSYYGDPDANTDFTQTFRTDWVRCWTAA